MQSSSALLLSRFVTGREMIDGVGLQGDELVDASVADPGPVKSDHQGALTGTKIIGIAGHVDAGQFLILPVKSRT